MNGRDIAETGGRNGVLVAAFYHFTRLRDCRALQETVRERCEAHGIRGTLLLASEGVNGTIAGRDRDVAAVIAFLRTIPGLANLTHRESRAAGLPFRRLKVRVRREIVTMGVVGLDPLPAGAGKHVAPGDWNALASEPQTVVIDTRNAYETAIGTFEGAVAAQTRRFREFPGWMKNRAGLDRDAKIALFCTGGIRCEKAAAWMKAEGYGNVFQLEGGILKYLEEAPKEKSLWRGGCFVFDGRVAVAHGLEETAHMVCRACRHPLTPEETGGPRFEYGVSCHRCAGVRTDVDRARYRERRRQMLLAHRRGAAHMKGLEPTLSC